MDQILDVENKTDEELVILTRSAPDAYYYLVARYEDKILRYVRRITNYSKEITEDLGQEIFLKAYENIHDFDTDLKFSSWLYRIAHNHVVSYWRKNKKNSRLCSLDADESFKNILKSDETMSCAIDRGITALSIAEAMGKLRPLYKEVLVLRYMEDREYQEISDIIKKPVGTVGTLIARAKKAIKANLDINCLQ